MGDDAYVRLGALQLDFCFLAQPGLYPMIVLELAVEHVDIDNSLRFYALANLLYQHCSFYYSRQ